MTIDDTRKKWLALIVLCLGDLLIVLDVSIVNVALPSIREDLGFTESSLAWVLNAYTLTFGGFMLLAGRMGDLYGHRRVFVLGVGLFTLASLACGLATSQEMLVGARAIQGIGGAVVAAVALSLIMTLFTEPAERAKAMGVIGFVAAGGGSIGVLAGGIITDLFSWHWIFLVNIPIGIGVIVACLVLLPGGGARPADGRLDVAGAVLVTGSLMLAVYAIVNGNEQGWTSAQTLGLLALAVAGIGAFVYRESRAEAPLMPLGILKLRSVATSNIVGILWSAAMFAMFFLSALYLQLVLGYSPLQVGLAFLPANLIMAAFSLGLSAKIVMRYGTRLPLVAGMGFVAARARALRARSGRRQLRRRRPSGHGHPRDRDRDRDEPAAARGDERRQAGGVRARLGHRQHVLHDGRRARPRRAGERRGGTDGRRHVACRAHGRLSRRVPHRSRVRGRRRHRRRRVHARRPDVGPRRTPREEALRAA